MAYMRDSTGTRMDTYEVPARQDIPRVMSVQGTYSPTDLPPAILDLNYQSKMGLYGIETHSRPTTDTYTDMAGVTQTAPVDAPVFDRITQNGWVLPVGLKLIPGTTCQMNVSKLLPSTYTIVLDVARSTAFTNPGPILELSDGSTANRVIIQLNSSYQANFLVQSGGVVVVNQSMGAVQSWNGQHRRLVITVAPGAFAYSDNGVAEGTANSGGAPNPAALTTLKLGGGGFAGWVKRLQILPGALLVKDVMNAAAGPTPIACYGDSLTFGTGASPTGNYPTILRQQRFPVSAVYNGGVGGDTSTQIKTRMLADVNRHDWTTVIWAGRNNFADPATVLADIATMVGVLPHRRFLIKSIINRADGTESPGSTAYNQIMALNTEIQAAYPNNYLDIRSLLVSASGGANDTIAMAWSYDGLHLNNTGYAYVGAGDATELRNRGWY